MCPRKKKNKIETRDDGTNKKEGRR